MHKIKGKHPQYMDKNAWDKKQLT